MARAIPYAYPATVIQHGSNPRRISVLFILPSLQGGGAERMVTTILRHLDRRIFLPSLAVLDSRNPAYAGDVPADVVVIDLGGRRVRRSVPAVLRLVRRLRPDVVFTTIAHLNLGVALAKPFFPRRTRLVAREAGVVSEVLAGDQSSPLWRIAYRYIYRLCDRIVCQSEYMRADLLKTANIPYEKTMLIYNPVDLARVRGLMVEPVPAAHRWLFDDGDDSIRLVAVGRLTYEKGFDLLIRAVALCGDPRLRLIILGTGELRQSLEALATELGVGRRVHLLGFQSNPYSFVSRSDALVLSSRHEGLPNVVLEALACRTPVIATPAPGGVFEILEGREECVVSSAVTAESLATSIKEYPFERGRERGVPDLSQFSVDRICGQYQRLFESLVEGAA